MILFGHPPEGRDINNPGHPLELPLKHPVLNRFQVGQRGVVPDQLIAINLGDGPPGRENRLNTRWKGHHRQPVQDLLPIHKVLGAEIEIEFDVTEAEEGQGADIRQARHAGQGGLDRDRNLAFNFLGRPPRILGNHLNHRRRRIRVRGNV